MGSFNKLKSTLEENQRFVLVCHIDPDGDAIGSISALGRHLRQKGKEVTLICKDTIPEIFGFLDEENLIGDVWPEKYDCIILLDNGDFRRTGFQEQILAAKNARKPIVNIDHHPKNDIWKIASINCANDQASSTCELLYEIFDGLNVELTSSIATSLLAGIFYDTGGFQHQNTSEKVLDIASHLLRYGARLKKISEKLSNEKPISLFKLWGIALNRLKINKNYGLAVSVITQADLKETGASEEEISGLVNLLNSVPEAKSALLLYETKDAKIKGSLRTESDQIDVSKIAGLIGGGGHKKAAGFSISGRIEAVDGGWRII